MSYRIMPPGSYIFWRIGILSPLYRWALTIVACLGLIFLWHGVTSHFLFCVSSQHRVHAQCATQLAELACVQENATTTHIVPVESAHPSLALLNLCEQQGLTIQSCSCNKPTKKNNFSVQRVVMACTGTLVQMQGLFSALASREMCIANVEVTLKQQQNKLYSCIFTYDCTVN